MTAPPPSALAICMISEATALEPAMLSTLGDLGWRTCRVATVAEAIARLGVGPALVLFVASGTPDDRAAVTRLRAAGGDAASVPVLGIMHATSPDPDAGFDGYIDADLPVAEQAAQADCWKADGEVATVARLETVFGRAEICGILGRFRVFLIEALVALERGDARMLAHRVAGMAGTVGFAAVGRAWNAVSDDAALDTEALYRHTRVAIATIDTILLSPAAPD